MNFLKGVITGHVGCDAPAVEGQAGRFTVARSQTSLQADGPISVRRRHGGCDFKTGRLIVDVIARVGMDRDQQERSIAGEGGVELTQQIDVEIAFDQIPLDQSGDGQVNLGLGQTVAADRS